jgi:hypothetical protein
MFVVVTLDSISGSFAAVTFRTGWLAATVTVF